jgi:hypothetical protein
MPRIANPAMKNPNKLQAKRPMLVLTGKSIK